MKQAAWAKINADATADRSSYQYGLTWFPLDYRWIIEQTNIALASGNTNTMNNLAAFIQFYNVNLSPYCPYSSSTTTTTSSSVGFAPVLLNLPGLALALRNQLFRKRKKMVRVTFASSQFLSHFSSFPASSGSLTYQYGWLDGSIFNNG